MLAEEREFAKEKWKAFSAELLAGCGDFVMVL